MINLNLMRKPTQCSIQQFQNNWYEYWSSLSLKFQIFKYISIQRIQEARLLDYSIDSCCYVASVSLDSCFIPSINFCLYQTLQREQQKYHLSELNFDYQNAESEFRVDSFLLLLFCIYFSFICPINLLDISDWALVHVCKAL